ncbi:MAG: DUF4331 domain-containing protein [Acidobacteriota bacterium]
MKRRSATLLGLLIVALVFSGVPAMSSSHREAPFITKLPKVDSTDFYMFRSYETGRENFVTLVANYIPLQDPYGAPNYFSLDPEAVYNIHIDNNGDAQEDLTFRFQFTNTNKDIQLDVGPPGGTQKVSIALLNAGVISAGNTGLLNVVETYTVDVLSGRPTNVFGSKVPGTPQPVTNASTGSSTFVKPVDNIGNKSIPNYAAYAAAHVYSVNIPGCSTSGRLFVGQRKDSFIINIGEIFDLVNISNPLGPRNAEADDLADKNVTSLALELPISCITTPGNPTIGAWTSAGVRRLQLFQEFFRPGGPAFQSGPFIQVSRLGSPLVNELFIGLKDKDRFNSSEPRDDAQFLSYVANPTLPAILELLFGAAGVKAPTTFPRSDLIAAFLTGVDGLNKNGSTGEMLRLNTSIAAKAAGLQNDLGVIGGDTAGFPNGRRPGDDSVDIALRVAMGVLLPAAQAPSGQLPFTDGALSNASFFDSTFPYLRTPLPGSPNKTP